MVRRSSNPKFFIQLKKTLLIELIRTFLVHLVKNGIGELTRFDLIVYIHNKTPQTRTTLFFF